MHLGFTHTSISAYQSELLPLNKNTQPSRHLRRRDRLCIWVWGSFDEQLQSLPIRHYLKYKRDKEKTKWKFWRDFAHNKTSKLHFAVHTRRGVTYILHYECRGGKCRLNEISIKVTIDFRLRVHSAVDLRFNIYISQYNKSIPYIWSED